MAVPGGRRAGRIDGEMTRLTQLDNMRGIAMVLVVAGHLLAGNFVPAWYSGTVRDYLYSFHMALFFFISGFVAAYSYHPVHSLPEYLRYIWRKFKKFFPPFMFFGVVCLLLTLWSTGFTWAKFYDGLYRLIVMPRASHSGYLWFIYLLFVFYCILPIIMSSPGRWFYGWIVPASVLPVFPIPTPIFVLDHFSRFFFFFFLGCVGVRHVDLLRTPSSRAVCGAGALLFGLWSVAALGWGVWCEPYRISSGLLSIPACAFLAAGAKRLPTVNSVLARISADCFWIYLLHLFVIQLCAKIIDRFHPSGNLFFCIYAVSVTAAAIAIPIGLRRGCCFLRNLGARSCA